MDSRIIQRKLDLIRQRAIVQSWPIAPWQVRTARHSAPGEYDYDGEWVVVGGDASWPAGKTVFVRAQIETPGTVPPADLYIQCDAEGLEGQLSINGQPYAGIDVNHTRVTPPSGLLQLELEFISIPRVLCQPELQSERGRLRRIVLLQVDHAVEAAYYDLWFAWEAARAAGDERRRQLLDAALEDALLAVDVTAPDDQLRLQTDDGRRILRERVAAIAPDPELGRVFLTGHSHIDTAWLWPLQETVRKVGRTFSTACRMLERFPDYHFSCSQPQLYMYARQYYPQLYAEIKKWVQLGRWECTGAMWVEPDCNVPSGESLIRQMLHGLRFFRDEFGVRPRTCWLPDVFGYPASLPQILKGAGVEYFFTNKLHWQARNPFTLNVFWWEGIDGTRILAHIPKLKRYYNGWPNPEELNQAWNNVQQKNQYPEVLFPFGFGDGGGGPTEDQLEFAARARSFPSVPQSRQGGEELFFDDVSRAAPDLPLWVGELYLETHRGTYTTQAATKKANRKNELLLRDAELWGTLANAQGLQVNMDMLKPAWQNLLLLQFHDILPGSSIGQVYLEAAGDHARIETAARAVRDAACGALATSMGRPGDLIVFNSLSWARRDAATATITASIPDSPASLELVDAAGQAQPAQVIGHHDGRATIVFVPDKVPAVGYATFAVRQALAPAAHSLLINAQRMENRFFTLDLAEDGTIARLFDRQAGREVIPPGQPANRLQLFQDGPEREAAWNIHATYEKREYAWDPGTTIEVVEQGPVRAIVRITRSYRQSRLVQHVTLYDQVPRIDFVTRVDWQERQVMLKAAFPLDVRSPRATYDIQFGAVERPTHRNTSWEQEKFEVCAHQWADLSEAGYGVSLLNDCKYGYDGRGNVLRLTLLRGSEWPDANADRGHHEFTYSLFPHQGGWADAGTVQRGWELNVPLTCAPGGAAPAAAARSWLSVHGPAIVSALKPAEDGDGWILRLYEPNGGRGKTNVQADFSLRSVAECNLAEETIADMAIQGNSFEFAIGPFQIKSFRLRLR